MKIHISSDGQGIGTKVTDAHGNDISGAISGLSVRIEAGRANTAVIDVIFPGCEITADGFLSLESLKFMAEKHGYKLVAIDG